MAAAECMGANYWPLSLGTALHKRLGSQKLNIWTLGYPAPVLKKDDPYAYRESLTTGVRPCVRKLVHGGIGMGANRGIVFVGHSLGGLVVKAVITQGGITRFADRNESVAHDLSLRLRSVGECKLNARL